VKRIALFTDFSPAIGGGGAILRNLLRQLKDMHVQWFYTASTTVDVPGSIRIPSLRVSGSALGEVVDFCRLWSGWRKKELMEMAKPIQAVSADVHWVVANGVGIALGNLLKALQPEIPLHVTVHDDPEHAVLKRSRRYRYLSGLVEKPMRQLMVNASSVDVISRSMQEYYRHKFGIESEVVHLCVGKLRGVAPVVRMNNELHIGHIGSIYSYSQFAGFLRGVDMYSRKRGLKPVVKLIGMESWSAERFARQLSAGASVCLLGEKQEEEAITQLACCDFVYAAYPFGRSLRVFRQTSLPTKLSTYIQAQRPIFAHTPMDSTLANTVTQFQAGIVCPSSSVKVIARHVEMIENLEIRSETFECFREEIFGAHNVKRLERLLLRV